MSQALLRFVPTLVFVFFCVSVCGAFAQSTTAPGILSQMQTAFSNGQVVQQVQLSGTATWNVGSEPDSGTVSLTASTDGSSQMQLLLASAGQRLETQAGSGLSATCQWSGNDGVGQDVAQTNCWKPAVWFLPAFSFQPSVLPSYISIADLGAGTIGADGNAYHRVQSQFVFTNFPETLTADIVHQSTTDLDLEPQSLLPVVLSYSVLPDDGESTPVAIDIHYSDYRIVSGVQIPFLIQRYVNGSLQLAISVNSAEIH